MATASNGVVLPAGNLFVTATAGFPSSGTLAVQSSTGRQIITYASIAGPIEFSGCVGGGGILSTGGYVFAPLATTSTAAAALPAAVLNVISTSGFPGSGTLAVQTSAGLQVVSYAGLTGTTFMGCTGGTGTLPAGGGVFAPLPFQLSLSTAITAPSNGVVLPVAAINVLSTNGFASAGKLSVQTSAGLQAVSYLGTTPTSFTGCTSGIGAMATGGLVLRPAAQPSVGPSIMVASYAELAGVFPFNGVVGFSAVELLGAVRPGDGGGGKFFWDPSAPRILDDNQGIVFRSSVSAMGRWRREGFQWMSNPYGPATTVIGATPLPVATIIVASTASLPSAGMVWILSSTGLQTISYSAVGAGPARLLGCSGGTGTIANNAVVLNSVTAGWLETAVTINVRWFGAQGDGATDDTAAIQNAIKAGWTIANTLEGLLGAAPPIVRILIPAGKYFLSGCVNGTSALELPYYLALEGEGLPVLFTYDSTIPILRTAASWNRVSNLAFEGGLNHIAMFGATTSFLGSFSPSGPGGAPFDVDGCQFYYPTGPAILQDTSLSTAPSASTPLPPAGGVLPVTSTAGFPTTGTLKLVSSSGIQTLTYTGITPTSFTGCTGGTGTVVNNVVLATIGSTAIAAASGGTSYPPVGGVLNVGSTAGFPTAGTVELLTSAGVQIMSYTGTTATSLTGCAASAGLGSGTLPLGGTVARTNPSTTFQQILNVTRFTFYGAHLYWGAGDSVRFTDGKIGWGFTTFQTTADSYPLGVINSTARVVIENCSGAAGGPSATRAAFFVGTGLFQAQASDFWQTDGLPFVRARMLGNAYASVTGVQPMVLPYATVTGVLQLTVDSCDLTLSENSFWLEVYEAFPGSIKVKNRTSSAYNYGIWVDQGSTSPTFLLGSQTENQYQDYDGFQDSQSLFHVFMGFDPGAATNPTQAASTDITPFFILNRIDDWYPGDTSPQPNLFATATADGGAVGFGLAAHTGTSTDTSTGQSVTVSSGSSTPASETTASMSLNFSQWMGVNLPPGIYCFSIYLKANWAGDLWCCVGPLAIGAGNLGAMTLRHFEASDQFQRLWFPFYYPGNGAQWVLEFTTEALVPVPIAPWQPSATYAPGMRVVNGGNTYLCTSIIGLGTSGAAPGPLVQGNPVPVDGQVTWNFVSGPWSWLAVTAYAVGDLAYNAGNVYLCVGAGTSAASGGPTGAGTAIADSTVTWASVTGGAPGWIATHAYALGNQAISNGGIYQCTHAGTSSGTGPSGTGSSIADGTVIWCWIASSWTPTVGLGLMMLNKGRHPGPYVFPANASTSFGYVPRQYYGTSAPASGTYQVGDLVWNTAPGVTGASHLPFLGWVCYIAGSPGSWQLFAPLAGIGTTYTGSTGLTAPTASTGSNDRGGQVSFTGAAHAYAAGDLLFQINYGAQLPNGSFVVFTPGNLATAQLFTSVFGAGTQTTGALKTGAAVTTVVSTTYAFSYVVVGA